MSKVVFLIDNLGEVERAGAINSIRALTDLNIVEIKERIMDKNPLAEFVIDGENHANKVKLILQWLSLAEQKKLKLRIYEVNDDDDFLKMGDTSSYEIDKANLLSFI
jgi:hypothetical protein